MSINPDLCICAGSFLQTVAEMSLQGICDSHEAVGQVSSPVQGLGGQPVFTVLVLTLQV